MNGQQIPEGIGGLSRKWSSPIGDPEAVLDLPPGPLLRTAGTERLRVMQAAGMELLEIYRLLAKTGDNIVGLLLDGQETFFEWNHYPSGDAYDPETHSQFYYHAHRGASGEHGHFHTFMRAKGLPDGATVLPLERDEPWPAGNEAVAHLIAVSMDRFGLPTHLFTTNRWVTGETLYGADDVIGMLDNFAIEMVQPSWPVNRWLGAMIALFRPQIEELLHKRDAVLRHHIEARLGEDMLEDRELEITSIARIDVDAQIEAVNRLAGR